jgi:hypothetical protein
MHPYRLVSGLFTALVVAAVAQTATTNATPATQNVVKQSPYRNKGSSDRAELYYASTWGIDHLTVRKVSSGALIRFSYQVVDTHKAATVHDKRAEPHLVNPRTRAMLSVPAMENVGQLRQTEAIENGKEYWVLFSNKGDLVKAGDHVNVIIGTFFADGLLVE